MKVLIVDHSPETSAAAQACLQGDGLSTICAASGESGLETARREHPSLILLATDMPDLPAAQWIRGLTSDPALCGIPIILLISPDNAEDKANVWDLGAADYLPVPFDSFELRARVRAALRTTQAEAALRDSNRFNEQVISEAREGIVVYDRQLRYIAWNRFMEELTGVRAEQVLGRNALDVFPHLRAEGVHRLLERSLSGETVCSDDVAFAIPATGRSGWFSGIYSPHRGADGSIIGVIAMIRDVTESHRAALALRESEERFRTLVENLTCGVYRVTADIPGRIIQANLALANLLGYDSVDQLMRVPISDLHALPTGREHLVEHFQRSPHIKNRQLQLRRKDGSLIWVSATATAQHNPDGSIRWIDGILEDITDRKRSDDRLRHAAMHDALTGLPNRALFATHLAAAIERNRRNPEYRFAVMFLDLDRFKIINDSLGHRIGDQLLIEISRRLRSCLRSGDVVSVGGRSQVARLGGDEFVILLDGIHQTADAARVAERLHQQLAEPFSVEGHTVHVTASIGIVSSECGYDAPEDMIRDADTAMYRAKTAGKARHVIFDRAMHDQAMLRLKLENDLRRAVEQREFKVEYQPAVELETGRVVSFEAMVRWQHPQRGLIAPDQFIETAEETGLIVPIGHYVLEQAFLEMQKLRAIVPAQQRCAVAVNLSKRQLIDPELVRQIARHVEQTGIRPGDVQLEITEGAIMERADAVRPVLASLKQLGVCLAMDNFGTGHSSLGCLHRFPIDVLKIDRAFIADMKIRREYAAIVQAIVTLAHNLGMEVVGEGIESPEELVQLQAMGCELGQGRYFSMPIPAQDMPAVLSRTTWLRRSA